MTTIYLTASDAPVASIDGPARTVHATILPWDSVANTSAGPTRFARGSVNITAAQNVAWLMEHDRNRLVGHGQSFLDTPAALVGTFTAPENWDTELQAAHMRSGWSVGVDVIQASTDRDGVLVVSKAILREVSSVSVPAWDAARTITNPEG
jgi:phage head maturation protease